MASDPMIFQFIGDNITAAMNAYVNSTVPTVIGEIVGVAVLATTIYYIWLGYMTALGRLDGTMSAVVISAIRFAVIAAVALSAGNYLEWVVAGAHSLETGLAQMFAGSSSTTPTNVYQLLDQSTGQGWDLAGQLWEKAANRGWTEIMQSVGEYIEASIIAAATIIIAAPAGAMIILAKTVLELLLGIGPIFVMCLMWAPTRSFFDRWLGAVFTQLLQVALLCAVLAFALKMFNAVVSVTDVNSSSDSPLFGALRLLVLTAVMLSLLYRVFDIGAQLAGGMSSGVMTFGNLVRGTAAAVTSPIGAAKAVGSVVNAPSTRRDLESGMMATAGRMNHLAAGNTMWNPRYRQHVRENFGKNWGSARGGSVSED